MQYIDRGEQYFQRYTFADNNPYKYTDPSGEILFAATLFSSEITTLVSYLGAAIVGVIALAAVVEEGSKALEDSTPEDDEEEGSFSDRLSEKEKSCWKEPPEQVTPSTTSTTDENVPSERGDAYERETRYDKYGRLKSRTDYTDHSRPESHDNPHTHETEYEPGYSPKGKTTPKPGTGGDD